MIGRIMTRSELLMFLEAMLRVEQQYRLHPEIEDGEIKQPLWVLGQGRSGTSFLQTLLGLDIASRTTAKFEAMFPVPFDDAGPDRHGELADARITIWVRVAPEMEAMHEFTGAVPTEILKLRRWAFKARLAEHAWRCTQFQRLHSGAAVRAVVDMPNEF